MRIFSDAVVCFIFCLSPVVVPGCAGGFCTVAAKQRIFGSPAQPKKASEAGQSGCSVVVMLWMQQ